MSGPFSHVLGLHGTVALERRIAIAENTGARAVKELEHRHGHELADLLIQGLDGSQPPTVLRGPGGEPQFPSGIVGSIAHAGGIVAARVGRESNGIRAVGIDLVDTAARSAGLAAVVGSARELDDAAAVAGRCTAAMLLLAVKESVFKAWYPYTGVWLEFEDIGVRLRRDGTIAVRHPRPAASERWCGFWSVRSGTIRAGTVVRSRRSEIARSRIAAPGRPSS